MKNFRDMTLQESYRRIVNAKHGIVTENDKSNPYGIFIEMLGGINQRKKDDFEILILQYSNIIDSLDTILDDVLFYEIGEYDKDKTEMWERQIEFIEDGLSMQNYVRGEDYEIHLGYMNDVLR